MTNAQNKPSPLIQVKHLKKYFLHQKRLIKAVDDVSFEIYKGETLGLVGESGCGKTTIGRTLLGIHKPTEGEIFFHGENISKFSKKNLKTLRRKAQIIFQDPYSSLNPRMTAEEIIMEPLIIHKFTEKKERVEKLLKLVGLSEEHKYRFPHEFSGGQRQRIGIARALSVNPEFIVCDEPLAALDVSIQAQIVNLLKKLQNEMGLTYLFISHDLAMVKYLSSKVAVMYLGKLVEFAPSDDLYNTPLHPYTQCLLSSIPVPNPKAEKNRKKIPLLGEATGPTNSPKGCVFSPRCPYAMQKCSLVEPPLKEEKPGHFVACHLFP